MTLLKEEESNRSVTTQEAERTVFVDYGSLQPLYIGFNKLLWLTRQRYKGFPTILKTVGKVFMNERMRRAIGSVRKHGFLLAVICLLVFNLILLARMIRTDYPYSKFGNTFVALMLLLNHIAYFYTRTGLASKIMKSIAWIWIAVVFVYLFLVTRWFL